jgi:hypothetical protein
MDHLTMPILFGCMVMVLSGPFRVLQEGSMSCLPNLGVVALYYLWKPGKGSKGRTLHAHVVGKRDLEHILRACPKLESPRRRNFVQILLPLSAMLTDQVEVARFFREVFEWDGP